MHPFHCDTEIKHISNVILHSILHKFDDDTKKIILGGDLKNFYFFSYYFERISCFYGFLLNKLFVLKPKEFDKETINELKIFLDEIKEFNIKLNSWHIIVLKNLKSEIVNFKDVKELNNFYETFTEELNSIREDLLKQLYFPFFGREYSNKPLLKNKKAIFVSRRMVILSKRKIVFSLKNFEIFILKFESFYKEKKENVELIYDKRKPKLTFKTFASFLSKLRIIISNEDLKNVKDDFESLTLEEYKKTVRLLEQFKTWINSGDKKKPSYIRMFRYKSNNDFVVYDLGAKKDLVRIILLHNTKNKNFYLKRIFRLSKHDHYYKNYLNSIIEKK